MTTESRGRDLFIVDNSVSGWTGLRYLEEWTGIAKAFDIATGYFEIGALLALDHKWQPLNKIRILMGAETTHRTRKAVLEAVQTRATEQLDSSIEADKEANPFLRGVPAILDALRSRQIECRVYDRDKFHAKAYITHAKLEVVGSQALVGSSNFTRPGLTKNIELNIQVQSAREVAQLQEWFEAHWNDASDVTDAVIETVSRHTHLYSPFDVYAKALQEFFRGHELTATEWDETHSKMFPKIDRYQKEAYWALMKIARQHGGAFLCDGVGLGKTFVGLMLIERLVLHEGKRVVLFAPKATKESVWDPHLREWLPHIGGVGGAADFSNLAVFSHTDLNRGGDFPKRFRRIAELADAVVIDEAHHFRNPGRKGDADEDGEPSRYYRLYELLDGAVRPKALYMLTATPINNRLSDFRHMAELFTRRDEAYFARTLGVNNVRAHFNAMEKRLRDVVGAEQADLFEHMLEAQQVLSVDPIFTQLVVQRSRAYARESQMGETGAAAVFYVDEADIDLNPRIGFIWSPKRQQVAIPTPGTNQKRYLAGALHAQTGQVVCVEAERKNSALFIELLTALWRRYRGQREILLILDNYGAHKSRLTQMWLAAHQQFRLLFQPVYHPWVNRIERLWKTLHDTITRNHRYSTINQLMKGVRRFLHVVQPFPGNRHAFA
jgi:transposase